MSIESLLDGKCDIYHMQKKDKGMGYGIKTHAFNYPKEPDEKNVDCHFNVNASANLTQTEAGNEYISIGKLQLPIGTDIRVNDKVVDRSNGLIYTAELPRNIREHHIAVTIQRKGTIKGVL